MGVVKSPGHCSLAEFVRGPKDTHPQACHNLYILSSYRALSLPKDSSAPATYWFHFKVSDHMALSLIKTNFWSFIVYCKTF